MSSFKKRKHADSGTDDEAAAENDDGTSTVKTLRYVEFYSGIGGWTMALEAAIKCLGTTIQLERLASLDHSDLCNRVFEHNFGPCCSKNKTSFSIERLSLQQMEVWAADILVMSPPCQPHTRQHSNQEQDLSDPRSASFLHICDLLEQMKRLPSLLFLENVVGFETSNSFTKWLQVLQKRDYHVGHFQLTPTQVGLPSERPRYYCVAILRSVLRTDDSNENPHSSLQKYVAAVNDLPSSKSTESSPTCHVWKAVPDLHVLPESSQDDTTIKPISYFLDKDVKQTMNELVVPPKVLHNTAAWCFDIVSPKDRRSACFTHSYGRYIKGTGSILYDVDVEGDGARAKDIPIALPVLQDPATREYDRDWMKDLDPTRLRYFSGEELAKLFGFSDKFTFPPKTSLKQQWKLMGNSLNVGVASCLVVLGLLLREQ
jgi:tRNA (cytosine38-C5)-methyltransferase